MNLSIPRFVVVLSAGVCIDSCAQGPHRVVAAEIPESAKSETRITLPMLDQPVIWSHDWKKYYDNAGKALVDAAKESSLDYQSLEKAMRAILDFPGNKRRVLLPDSASLTRVDGEPTWRIDLLWEYDQANPAGQYVIHICKFEFSRMQLRFAGSCD